MRELFTFYAKLHQADISSAFGDMAEKGNWMDLGEFMFLCKDFKIPIPKPKLQEMFKKSASFRHKPVNFKEFIHLLDKVGKGIIENRVEDHKKRIEELDKILKSQNGED